MFKPSFLEELNDLTICRNESYTLHLITGGIFPIEYQWQKEGADIPEGSVVVGVPGKVIKQADAAQQQHILNNAATYVQLAGEYARHG